MHRLKDLKPARNDLVSIGGVSVKVGKLVGEYYHCTVIKGDDMDYFTGDKMKVHEESLAKKI